ncbi:MAG: glycosyltransferase involved in cell wall biosynthesis [Candidatus Woesearchaeota archaeon]|jgi:glycosyltransferase involved in cell wall biosynthesis
MQRKNNSQAKLLVVFPGFFLPHVGGSETHTAEFVKRLVINKEYNVLVAAPNIPKTKKQETMFGVKVIRYPAFEPVSNFPLPNKLHLGYWAFMSYLFKQKPDVVMTRTMFFPNAFLGYMYAKIKKVPLIHVEHSGNYPQVKNSIISAISKLYMHTFGALIVRKATKLVCVSEGGKQFLKKNFTKKPVEVIIRGFDYKAIEKIKPRQITQETKKKIIYFVGRLVDGKGVQDSIRALSQRKSDYVFLIAGDGPYKHTLQKLATKLQVNAHFLGKVPNEESIAYMKAADLVVNPSHSEGQPTAVTEAIFSGANIIATDVGGTKELLPEWKIHYLLVKRESPKKLAQAIDTLLKQKTKPSKESINKLKKKFDWDIHVKKYKQLLDEVTK